MTNNRNKNNWLWVLLGIIFIVVAVVLVILFLLQGKTFMSTSDGELKNTSALSCTGTDIEYPFIVNDTKNHSMKIKIIFQSGQLNTISLTYQMYYDSVSKIEQNVTDSSIALDKAFYQDGLPPDSLGSKFSALSNSAQMSIFSEAANLNDITAKYFLLEDTENNYTQNNLKEAYEEKGLECIAKNELPI